MRYPLPCRNMHAKYNSYASVSHQDKRYARNMGSEYAQTDKNSVHYNTRLSFFIKLLTISVVDKGRTYSYLKRKVCYRINISNLLAMYLRLHVVNSHTYNVNEY